MRRLSCFVVMDDEYVIHSYFSKSVCFMFLWFFCCVLGMKLFGCCAFCSMNEPPHDKTNKMTCAPSEDSDQSVHLLSLIRVFSVRKKQHWVLGYPRSAQRRLIRLGRCPDWSDLHWTGHFVGFVMLWLEYIEPCYKKTCVWWFLPGKPQANRHSYRS